LLSKFLESREDVLNSLSDRLSEFISQGEFKYFVRREIREGKRGGLSEGERVGRAGRAAGGEHLIVSRKIEGKKLIY
jgi:hypothetical protein